MPRPTVDQVRGLGEFATLYQWDVSFVKPPAIAGEGGTYPTSEELNLRCLSTGIPKFGAPRITANIRGHQVHQPGPATYEGTLTLMMAETIDNKVSNFIIAWREACTQSITGAHGLKADVEAILRIVRMNRQNEAVIQYDLFGCWLEDYTPGELGAEPANMQPSLTVAYDYFREESLV